jgi:hypothetical protein
VDPGECQRICGGAIRFTKGGAGVIFEKASRTWWT